MRTVIAVTNKKTIVKLSRSPSLAIMPFHETLGGLPHIVIRVKAAIARPTSEIAPVVCRWRGAKLS